MAFIIEEPHDVAIQMFPQRVKWQNDVEIVIKFSTHTSNDKTATIRSKVLSAIDNVIQN